MKNLIVILASFFAVISECCAGKVANSAWEGVWLYKRYSQGTGGSLEITDCRSNLCNFSIGTFNGAHTCSIEGKLKIKNTHGEYKEKNPYTEDSNKEAIVTFDLDIDKNIITVGANTATNMYCGMQGYFTGNYENENNPQRYDAGFDCWAKNLNAAEKVICASRNLAAANKEMTKDYPAQQTEQWYNKRNACGKNTECLWDFYINSIKSGYVQKNGKIINLYDYMGELADDALYYPTDFSLLTDFFIKNMPADDYDTWISSFSQISLDNNKCNKCHYHKYGLAGLYTIMESAFYINQNEIWLAFIHIDNDDKKQNYIVVYALPDKTEKDIPPEFDEWLNRLKKHYPEGIKLKYFTNSELVDLPYFL